MKLLLATSVLVATCGPGSVSASFKSRIISGGSSTGFPARGSSIRAPSSLPTQQSQRPDVKQLMAGVLSRPPSYSQSNIKTYQSNQSQGFKSPFSPSPVAQAYSKLAGQPKPNQAPRHCSTAPSQYSQTSFGTDCVSYFDTAQEATFEQGQKICHDHGMLMASARSKDENDLLSSRCPGAWIAGRQFHNHMKTWVWATDLKAIKCPYWFRPYEPADRNGHESCVQMHYYGGWATTDCGLKNRIVCEKRICEKPCDNMQVWQAEAQIDTNAERKVANTPHLTGYFKGQGTNCVTFYGTDLKMNYDDADKYCRDNGLRMATPMSKAEADIFGFYAPLSWIGVKKAGAGISNGRTCLECNFWESESAMLRFELEPNTCPQQNSYSGWTTIPCDGLCPVVCEYRTCDPDCDQQYVPGETYPGPDGRPQTKTATGGGWPFGGNSGAAPTLPWNSGKSHWKQNIHEQKPAPYVPNPFGPYPAPTNRPAPAPTQRPQPNPNPLPQPEEPGMICIDCGAEISVEEGGRVVYRYDNMD